MSVTDMTARIQQIQSQLAMLAPATDTSTATAGSDFATALTDATAGSTATGSSAGGDAVVADARKYLGVPYVWGGTDPAKGLDCSGLVQHVYKDLGYDLPRVSYQQATAGQPVDSLADAKPGDVLAFGSPVHHVAIYIGNHQMIEAPRPGTDVRVSDVYETPTHIRRIIPDTATAGTAAGASRVAGVPYADLFNTASARYGVPAAMLSAVARQESGYNPAAVSPAGAQGLMQLMPGTARGLGVTNPLDPTQAVNGAARMLSGLLNRFGRTDLALAAYNAGPGAVLRYNGVPPYPETKRYVANVMSMMGAA